MWKTVIIVAILGLLGVTIFKDGKFSGVENTQTAQVGTSTSQELKEEEISIQIFPENPIQGEPVLIQVSGTSTVESIEFAGRELPVFIHKDKPSALTGIDLRAKTGEYDVEVEADSVQHRVLDKKLAVGERVVVKAPLGIPDKLGGDTPAAEKELINTLVQEGQLISAIKTSPEKLWSGEFRYPLEGEITITDVYGYSRQTVGSTISHKGTDFRAKVGTPVYAMNSGKIAFTRFLRNYGNTIAIDHGLGLLTIYMHLSEINVRLGDIVEKGQLIGKSGDTGYVLGPHLHLTIRINNISIDPEKFMAILGEL